MRNVAKFRIAKFRIHPTRVPTKSFPSLTRTYKDETEKLSENL
jgi:hypothetical protein